MELKNRFHLTYCEEYGMWLTMMKACYDHKNVNYKRFGAKKIKVCKAWQEFDNFSDFLNGSYYWKYRSFVDYVMYLDIAFASRTLCKNNTRLKCKEKKDLSRKKERIQDKYNKEKDTLNNYCENFIKEVRNLKYFFNIDWLLSFDNPEKLILLLRYVKNGDKVIGHNFECKEYYIQFINHFYYDAQFNKVYKHWVNCGRDNRLKPSLDHIVPKSKGGSYRLNNLRFITQIENYCKGWLSMPEWEEVKNNPEKFFI